MGVRGLTTFIAKDAYRYLERFELSDSYLIIDAYCIASQLYKWHCTRNDCFGGDYDKYAKVVYDFFKLLDDCNVTPVVVFDGGYENKKLKTVYNRMRDRISIAKSLNSLTQGSYTLFPLFMRDLFADIVLKLDIHAVRCDKEADQEIACLARSLNCPVLSYDSDFYIFGVLYIPFSTFEFTRRKKTVAPPLKSNYSICCQLYRIENFTKAYGDFDQANIPLIAILLGNDYITRGAFKNFYGHIKMPAKSRTRQPQQRKIVAVIRWLQNETYESAVRKILSRFKSGRRKKVGKQIQTITDGYLCRGSYLMQYLNLESEYNLCELELTSVDELLKQVEDATEYEFESNNSDDSDSSVSVDIMEFYERMLPAPTKYKNQLPGWFLDNYRKCQYPAAFMDICRKNMYFLTPQIDDYSKPCSHSTSELVLAALHKMLAPENAPSLIYLTRGNNGDIKKCSTPICEINLPKIKDIQSITSQQAQELLFRVLDVYMEEVEFLNHLPGSWRLYFLSMVYWVKNAKPRVTYSHLYSLVLCAIVLNKVDQEIGFYRSNIKFFAVLNSKLLDIEDVPTIKKEINKDNFKQQLRLLNYKECLLCMKELIKYFQMDEKMRTHLKLFDVRIVDSFAQFQSCLLHISYLNKLLNMPFKNFLICDFFDGTFLYNMCLNLSKRRHIRIYLSTVLKDCISVVDCCYSVVMMIKSALRTHIDNPNATKKRRRKKKKSKEKSSSDEREQSESEEEIFTDVNNRFSLLNIPEE